VIVIVGGTKGGTGKSTIITNLVAIDVGKGNDSLLVDSDKQGSASTWAAIREETTAGLIRVPSAQKYGQLVLTNELKSWAKKYANVFVDAGGYDSEELRSALVAADRLYIPVRPAQFDLWTLPKIILIAKQSQIYNPNLQFFFVINGAHTSPNVKEAEEVLALAEEIEGMVFCQTIIHSRRAFYKAPVAGRAVTEMKGSEYDKKAAEEMMSLYEEIFNA